MSIPFITRTPSKEEVERLRLAISSFCDGSGMIKQANGTTFPGWRDFERAIASVLGGIAPETKAIFDVIIPSSNRPNIHYGVSVKSKQLDRPTAIEDLSGYGRVYMELTNSPAKLWAALSKEGITEEDFRKRKRPDEIGKTILEVIYSWHEQAAQLHDKAFPGYHLDLQNSVYLVVSYSKPRNRRLRRYQLHSFNLSFPSGIVWSYRSEKCLRGADPDHANETLFDWYALSGGQLKYYPRASTARYASPPFSLAKIARQVAIVEKAAKYWPRDWLAAGGRANVPIETFAEELELQSALLENYQAKQIIRKAVAELRSLG